MGNAAAFFVTVAVLLGFACGGSTSTPPDAIDGSADANGVLDVAEDATGEVAHDAIADLVVRDMTATWQSLRLDNGTGPCPPQISCSSSWVVSPDGQMATNRLGDAGAAQMTSPDLAELDSIVASTPFLVGMANGFVCNPPPTDVFVSLRFERRGTSQTQGVTGCVISGPSGNLPRRVSELLTKY